MWDEITYDEFVNLLEQLFGYAGANLFSMIFTIQTLSLPKPKGKVKCNSELPSFLIKQGICAINVKENCNFFFFALADCKTPDEKKYEKTKPFC
jgi:hypothetical protein